MTNNNDDITVDIDLSYQFKVSGKTSPDFTMSTQISQWLVDNLTFGKQPVCDVYIDHIDYDTDFDFNRPKTAHTIVLFYLKGANNHTYMQVASLHDYIMQEFTTNPEFKELTGVVRDTFVNGSKLMMQPINKKWGVMGAFELTHALF